MIKTILWDFDGVILDSMKIKGDGFVELFKDYEKVKLLEEYHYNHGGVSRFDKIKYFFNEVLEENIDEQDLLSLAEKFGEIIHKRLFDSANLIDETIKFIENNYLQYNFQE